jgi:hypothetical protein
MDGGVTWDVPFRVLEEEPLVLHCSDGACMWVS